MHASRVQSVGQEQVKREVEDPWVGGSMPGLQLGKLLPLSSPDLGLATNRGHLGSCPGFVTAV